MKYTGCCGPRLIFFIRSKQIPVSEPHPTGVRALRRKLAPPFIFYLDEAIKIPPRLEESANVQTNGSVTKMKYYTVAHNAHMYEIVGGLRATVLSAVKQVNTGNGVAYTHINPQYFIHDVGKRNFSIFPSLQVSMSFNSF